MSIDMEKIYNKLKTPYKLGAVVKQEGYMTDSPTVFCYKGKWYMYYVRIANECESSGYETHFSSSDNLIDWRYEGVILRRSKGAAWDSRQVGGYAAFPDINFGGTNKLQRIDDKYYIAYIGGYKDGYETDPLQAGMAYSKTPNTAGSFIKLEKPVLSPLDREAREFENVTIFKSYMFEDPKRTLGHKYVNAYNARGGDFKERIYLAVSDDGVNWSRYGEKPVIDEVETREGLKISGDPQILLIDGVYVMLFFRCEKSGTYNTFACSENLTDWVTWEGEPLIKCEYEWENVFAHKSYVIKEDGIVYHFYCAVNDKKERFIALATSEDLR